MRLLGYELMPNHWHLVLRPEADGEMSRFLRWVTATHTMRYHAHYHTSGEGHLDQGRFKSFPIQDHGHFLTVCRYVERNALRAGLVKRAQDWRWGSLWRWLQPMDPDPAMLSPWPIPRLPHWVERVNQAKQRGQDSLTASGAADRLRPCHDHLAQMAKQRGQDSLTASGAADRLRPCHDHLAQMKPTPSTTHSTAGTLAHRFSTRMRITKRLSVVIMSPDPLSSRKPRDPSDIRFSHG